MSTTRQSIPFNKSFFASSTVDEINDYLANKDGTAIMHIEKSNQTKEMAFNAVSNSVMALKYVNKRYWKPDLFEAAIKSNVKVACTLIPEKQMTHDLWVLVAKEGGYEYIPTEKVNEAINLAAIESAPSSDVVKVLKMMTKDVTANVIISAINLSKDGYVCITYVNNLSKDVYEQILEEYPMVIRHIADTCVDFADWESLQLYTISLDPDNLKYIYESDQTRVVCAAAVKAKSSTIKYVRKRYYYDENVAIGDTTGLLEDAILDDPMNLLLVQNVYWTPSIIEIALDKCPDLLAHIWEVAEEDISTKSYEKCVAHNPKYITMVRRNMTNSIAKIAVTKDPETINHIGAEFQTQELQLIAVKDDPDNIIFIHRPTLKTRLVCFWERIKRG